METLRVLSRNMLAIASSVYLFVDMKIGEYVGPGPGGAPGGLPGPQVLSLSHTPLRSSILITFLAVAECAVACPGRTSKEIAERIWPPSNRRNAILPGVPTRRVGWCS